LGIRSIAYRRDRYWLVAGSYDTERQPRLYQWRGGADTPQPVALPELAKINPEAITFFDGPDGEQLWVLSDDGTEKIAGADCKKLKDSRRKRFRAVAIPLHGKVAVSK
jgi:hypothetical protein